MESEPASATELASNPFASEETIRFLERQASITVQRTFRGKKAREKYLQEIQRRRATDPHLLNDADIFTAAYAGDPTRLRHVIARGACINARGKFNSSPLHYAVAAGCSESVQLLLAEGSDVHSQDAKGDTALHIAARMDRADIVKKLVACGADPSAQNFNSKTPRAVADRIGGSDRTRNALNTSDKLSRRLGAVAGRRF